MDISTDVGAPPRLTKQSDSKRLNVDDQVQWLGEKDVWYIYNSS